MARNFPSWRRWPFWASLVVFGFLGWLQWSLHKLTESSVIVVTHSPTPALVAPPANHPNYSYRNDVYHQFHPPTTRILLPPLLTPVPILPQPCLSEYFNRGTLSDLSCASAISPPIDFIWTWINGSDPHWAAQKAKYSSWDQIGRAQGVPVRHYRDHGELRHSVRAVEESMSYGKEQKKGRYKLMVGDWDGEGEGHMRIGQKPRWLPTPLDGQEHGMEMHWHSEIWSSFKEEQEMSNQERRVAQAEMLRKSLPTFDSFSIESNLFNLPTPSPLQVYLNDDFFLTSPHTPADFHSLLLGPLIPFSFSAPNYTWPVFTPPNPGKYVPSPPMPDGIVGFKPIQRVSCNHEWSSLGRSNYLIGQRFGHRHRTMLLHIPKPVLQPLLLESAIIWGSEFQKSTRRRFREDGITLPGDYNPVWMAEMLLVERAREAMLWVWVVVKMGEESGERGYWGREEYVRLRGLFRVDAEEARLEEISKSTPLTIWQTLFGRPPTLASSIPIHPLPPHTRRTLHPSHLSSVFKQGFQTPPIQNTPGWTSLDGPIPPMGATVEMCEIGLEECFGGWWRANRRGREERWEVGEMFRRVAFEKRECGDCILSALIHASGPLGMSQIIPTKSHDYIVSDPKPRATGEQPHLPLAMSWKKIDFSLGGILGGGKWGKEVELRDWSERLIAWYIWSAVGNSTSVFAMIRSAKDLRDVITKIQADPPPATVALNDDLTSFSLLEEQHLEAGDIGKTFEDWLETRWPEKGGWEL